MHRFLAVLLLLPLTAVAEIAPDAPVLEAPAAEAPVSHAPVSETPAAEAPAGERPAAPQALPPIMVQTPTPEPPPAPLGYWSLRGFLNGGPVTLSQMPHEGTWRIHTGASEIVLRPATREAQMAGHPLPWPEIPLTPASGATLQPGPEMPERACRFWIQETTAGTHAWCWDAQGRPQRILTRQSEQWRLVFDAETRETASLWRLLRAIGG